MDKPIIFMFSGQGAQYYHMGRNLFYNNSTFRYWMNVCDRYYMDNHFFSRSILDVIYDSKKAKDDIFKQAYYTGPALFCVQYSLCQVLLETGIKPDYLFGTSLGEIVSLAVADVISIKEGISITKKLAEIYRENCVEGGMLAIFDSYQDYYKNQLVYENTEIAAVNFVSHFVISGRDEDLNRVKAFLKSKNILFQPLPVSYAYHSKFIKPAEHSFLEYLKTIEYRSPCIPIISCSLMGELFDIDYNTINYAVKKRIEFQKTIQWLENRDDYFYLDLGPSGTLATFLKYLLNKKSLSEIRATINPFGGDIENIREVTKLLTENKEEYYEDICFPRTGVTEKRNGGYSF